LRVDIANTDGPAGDYQLSVDTYGKLKADLPVSGMTVRLAVGEKKAVVVPIRGVAIGKGVLGAVSAVGESKAAANQARAQSQFITVLDSSKTG